MHVDLRPCMDRCELDSLLRTHPLLAEPRRHQFWFGIVRECVQVAFKVFENVSWALNASISLKCSFSTKLASPRRVKSSRHCTCADVRLKAARAGGSNAHRGGDRVGVIV